MKHALFLRPCLTGWRATLLALFIVLCFACDLSVLAAAPPTGASAVAIAPAGAVVGDWSSEILGNRTRMIQIGAIFVLVGVFLLSVKYR